MLKLAHLVDDKIHARSTGPYSGYSTAFRRKSSVRWPKIWGMEVWALEPMVQLIPCRKF